MVSRLYPARLPKTIGKRHDASHSDVHPFPPHGCPARQSHGRQRQRMTTDHAMHGMQQKQPHTRSGTVITFLSLPRDATTVLGASSTAGAGAGADAAACDGAASVTAPPITPLDVGDTGNRTLTVDMGGTTNVVTG